MLWRYERGNGLWLVEKTAEELNAARSAVAELECVGDDFARTTGRRLKEGLQDGFLPEHVVFSLSRWCNSGGRYQSGVLPAQRISMKLFNRCILPRLRSAGGPQIPTLQAQRMLDDFLKRAGALAC